MKRIRFRLTAYTDPAGKFNDSAPKKGNEDDMFVDSELANGVQGEFVSDSIVELNDAGCLMVVADGMGGMNAGEVASCIAIETVKNAFAGNRLTEDVLASSKSRRQYMERIVVEADSAIKQRSKNDKECEGMGSTLVMAWLYGSEVTVTWCGDSRAYLFRESEGIRQISKDHSYVQSLVDNGTITEEAAFDHPYGNIITRSLGDPEKTAVPDSVTVPVCKGDVILVCSDGLSGVLRDRRAYDEEGKLIPGDNIEDLIRNNRSSMVSCREVLWAAAENAGWYDNVTAVLCEITDGDETPAVLQAEPQSVTKSFISLKVSKRALKTVLAALLVLFLGGAAYYLGKHLYGGKVREDANIKTEIERLVAMAESSGQSYFCRRLKALPETVSLEELEQIEDSLALRIRLVDSLKRMIDGNAVIEALCREWESILKDSSNISEVDFEKLQALEKEDGGDEAAVVAPSRSADSDKVKELLEKISSPQETAAANEMPSGLSEVPVSEILFKIVDYKAEKSDGINAVKKKLCGHPFTDAVVFSSDFSETPSALQIDVEYKVILFSYGTFNDLVDAVKRNGITTDDGLTPNDYRNSDSVQWNALETDTIYKVSVTDRE